jgi:hypothetical protein
LSAAFLKNFLFGAQYEGAADNAHNVTIAKTFLIKIYVYVD